MTINELIAELQNAKEQIGGDKPIFAKDTDTGMHLLVSGVRESNNVKGKVLIVPESYADYMTRSTIDGEDV